jgi:hypothetical protein
LVDEIIGDRATALKFKAADLRQFAEAGIAIAACEIEEETEPAAARASLGVAVGDVVRHPPGRADEHVQARRLRIPHLEPQAVEWRVTPDVHAAVCAQPLAAAATP